MGKGSISAINLTDGSVETETISGVVNPVKLFYANNCLYVLDLGSTRESVVPWYQQGWEQETSRDGYRLLRMRDVARPGEDS